MQGQYANKNRPCTYRNSGSTRSIFSFSENFTLPFQKAQRIFPFAWLQGSNPDAISLIAAWVAVWIGSRSRSWWRMQRQNWQRIRRKSINAVHLSIENPRFGFAPNRGLFVYGMEDPAYCCKEDIRFSVLRLSHRKKATFSTMPKMVATGAERPMLVRLALG